MNQVVVGADAADAALSVVAAGVVVDVVAVVVVRVAAALAPVVFPLYDRRIAIQTWVAHTLP